MTDTLEVFGTEYTGVTGIKATDDNGNTKTYIRPEGTLSVSSAGTKDVTNYASATVPAGSVTAPSSISGTSATVSTGTNTLTLTKSISVTPNVTTAGYITAGTAGNSSVSLTANVTTKAAATITPSTSNQTIASGTYLTGTQTIAGDADLVAGNIKSGVNIFGVTGTYDPAPTYTITVSGTGAQYDCYVQLNGTGPQYYTSGDTITFKEGDVLNITAGSPAGDGTIKINGTTVASTYGSVWYNYTLPASNVTAKIVYSRDDALIEVFTGVVPSAIRGATTWTPGTSNQTIASGTYLTGAQTIAGDADLVAGNIKSGVNIFGVAGTLVAGPDVPIFTCNNGSYSCNKTFSECWNLINTATPSTGAVVVYPDYLDVVDSLCADASRSSSSVIKYVNAYGGVPSWQLNYSSDGTIAEAAAVDSVSELTVTHSGTYAAPWNEVYNGVYVGAGSVTAPSSISGSSATVSTGTNTLTLTKTVSVTPNVSTAGYITSGTAGNASVSLTASVTTKAAATITPTTSNQTIASGTYLTGTQTIAGDANLVGSNIISGKSIFGVSGTVAFQTYYTGSSAPSSSLGVNGDIYLQR